jgi:hypothetical protein
VILRPHGRKENQRVMNRQQSTSISGKHESENHEGPAHVRFVKIPDSNST